LRLKATAKKQELAAAKKEVNEKLKEANTKIIEKRKQWTEKKEQQLKELDETIDQPIVVETPERPPVPKEMFVDRRAYTHPMDFFEMYNFVDKMKQDLKTKYKTKYNQPPKPEVNLIQETAKDQLQRKVNDEIHSLARQALFGHTF
jgi:hypothetical protein